jgi:uncharacterized damage-inducible protein DinB
MQTARKDMDLIASLRTGARANRLANQRLHASMTALAPAEFHAPRTSFFPSLGATLNHILAVDIYYLAALHREADMEAQWQRFVPATSLAELAPRQQASDERLIRFVDALDAAGCDAVIVLDRSETKLPEHVAHVLAHLTMHQTHHRGQVHAMLAGTAVKPPQLDEFLMPSDAPLRVADLAALGWTERDLFGG